LQKVKVRKPLAKADDTGPSAFGVTAGRASLRAAKSLLVLQRLQNNYHECADRPEEQRAKPPTRSAPAFGLGKAGIDERKRKPTNSVFTCAIHNFEN